MINFNNAPVIEVILQNTTKDCADMELAKKVAADMNDNLPCGRIVLEPEMAYTCCYAVIPSLNVMEECLPVMLNLAAQSREIYATSYHEALAAKQ